MTRDAELRHRFRVGLDWLWNGGKLFKGMLIAMGIIAARYAPATPPAARLARGRAWSLARTLINYT